MLRSISAHLGNDGWPLHQPEKRSKKPPKSEGHFRGQSGKIAKSQATSNAIRQNEDFISPGGA
jgi:hypothetical protein